MPTLTKWKTATPWFNSVNNTTESRLNDVNYNTKFFRTFRFTDSVCVSDSAKCWRHCWVMIPAVPPVETIICPYIWYQTYLILNLSKTIIIRYWIYQIPNLPYIEHNRYQTYHIGTELIMDYLPVIWRWEGEETGVDLFYCQFCHKTC